jgi:ABC-type bacteriocin/lantibiotic exporter with double-glycine peptidase domain
MSILDIAFLALLLFVIHFYTNLSGISSYIFLPKWLLQNNSLLLITLVLILFSLKNITAYLIYRSQSRFVGTVATRLSETSLLQYLDGTFGNYVTIDSSTQIRKICFQPFEFCQYILSGILQILTQFCLIILTIAAILIFNAKLFLLLLCILLPGVIAVFYFIKKKLAVTKQQVQSSNERSFQYLLDALKGYVEANIYDKKRFFLQRFIRQRSIFSNNLFDSLSVQTLPSRVIEIFAVIGLFLLIVIANWSGDGGNSAFITLGAFMAAAYKIIPGMVKIINVSGQMRAYQLSTAAMLEVDNKNDSVATEKEKKDIYSVTFRNVSFDYGEIAVLHNFNLEIKKGELVGISGKSGKGKTTLLNLLLGFFVPSKGQILVNDALVDSRGLQQYWPSVSYVRQQPFLMHDSILKNITLDEGEYDPVRLNCALKTAGLDELILTSPEGLGKVITENGKNISGGQQQRIALARALYKDAKLILLDEPFNELDETAELELLHHFRKVADSGKLVILITHDSRSLQHCDKIVSLNEQ